MAIKTFKKLILLILDGFGIASPAEGNAVTASNPRNLNYLINNFPALTLQASGPAVGLPWGQRGNSEVGHLNIGAGRVVAQDLIRINGEIASGNFFKNSVFLEAINFAKTNNSRIHLIGLVSSGGVHSSEEHLWALLELLTKLEVHQVFLHMITDGRDTAPKVAMESLDRLTKKVFDLKTLQVEVATIAGRFYAMDRGGHLELIQAVLDAMVFGVGPKFSGVREAILYYYDRQVFDETIPPSVIVSSEDSVPKIATGDAVILFNFRPDRMVQITRALSKLKGIFLATMTNYEKDLPVHVVYPSLLIKNTLPEVISRQNLTQLHIAESEKYAHVTSFFNGGIETPWPAEEREIVNSPGSYTKRYENVPEMSVFEVAEKVIEKFNSGTSFILVNFANPDMVGHTGNKKAAVKAMEAVDLAIGRIFEKVFPNDACFLITADHGNLEEMIDVRRGTIDKQHSENPVPFLVIGRGLERKTPKTKGYLELPSLVPTGILADVAPTVLALLNIPKPPEMSAISLVPLILEQIES